MQNDIFTKCIDPADFLSLKELKDKTMKEDQDEIMSEEAPQVVEEP
jgi:CRISPR/Cas system-associated endoribonuclease Cas2